MTRSHRAAGLAAALAFFALPWALPAWQARPLPPAPGAAVVNLTAEPGFFTEPGIAVDPLDPRLVAATFQDNVHISVSADAGAHWTAVPNVAPPEYRVSGDVSITYDNRGHAIECHMAFDRLGTYSYWAHGSSRNGLYIRRSLDGGRTWEANEFPVIAHGDRPVPPWEDKPFIVADQSQGPYAGRLYVGWTRWTLTGSEIRLSRSADTGKTWSSPIEIDGHPGLPRDDNGANEGFWGVVGPDSTLYVVWANGRDIIFTRSRDGGRRFAPPRAIVPTAPIMYQIEDLSRSNGFPQLAIDPRGRGRLYVVWADYRNGDVDVFLSRSDNGGRTWTAATRVNDDPLHDGADQFFPALAVDAASGDVYVAFYDRRGDPRNRRQTITLARSSDQGRTFTNYAWTQAPFAINDVFLGDYIGLAANRGRVYGIWTEHVAAPPGPRPAAARRRNDTVVRVGVAQFGGGEPR